MLICLFFVYNVIFVVECGINLFRKVRNMEDGKIQVLTRWWKKREERVLSISKYLYRNGRLPFLVVNEDKSLDESVTIELLSYRNPTISQRQENVVILHYLYIC